MSLIALFQFPHFILILTGIILFSISILFVIIHKPKNWFLLHTSLATIGILLSAIGIMFLSGLVLTIPHAVFGLISIIFLFVAAFGGLLAYRLKKKNLRLYHIWGSRFVYTLSLIALILGILTFI